MSFPNFNIKDQFNKFVQENPMKVYPLIFIAADTAWGSYGVTGGGSLLWAAGAACGVAAHGLKIAFGKGGESLAPSDKIPDKFLGQSLLKFLMNTGAYTLGLFTKNYWRDVAAAFKTIKPAELKNKCMRALTAPHHYPLDAGWLLFAAGSLCYTFDAANIMGLRESAGSPLEISVGLSTLFASTLGFTTDRTELAGRAYTIASWLSIPTAILSGHVGMMMSIPLYFMGNYMLGKVIPPNQSQHTIDEQKNLRPPAQP